MEERMAKESRESSSPTKRKGKIYKYVSTSRGLFPWAVLRKAALKDEAKATNKKSKQMTLEKLYMTENNLVPPPFDMGGILLLMDNCSYFDACVRQIATDVTGQGYDITEKDEEDVTEPGAEGEPGKQEQATSPIDTAARAEKKRIADFFNVPNDDGDSIEEICKRLVIDLESVGQLCLEVSRGADGNVDGLFHVPAHTIRVHRDGNKYCQIRGADKRWFKKFGYENDVNENDGGEENVPDDKKANELIFYRNYYPQSSYYGQPPILPSVGSVRAMIGARDYNLSFFENYGVPAALVIVEGDWDEENVKEISDFIDTEIKGSQNAHKTVVLNPPEGGKVTWTPLVTEMKEGHFKLYSKGLRDEILVPFKMPPYRIGIAEQGQMGGNVASEATRVYIDSTVDPLKQMTQHLITVLIIAEGLQSGALEFWWNDIDVRDLGAIATRCALLFGIGAMNRKQVCEELDVEPPKDENAETYYISTSYLPLSEAGTGTPGPGAGKVEELSGQVNNILAAAEKSKQAADAARIAAEEAGNKIE
jgi:PBSX family phage portal protein